MIYGFAAKRGRNGILSLWQRESAPFFKRGERDFEGNLVKIAHSPLASGRHEG